VWPSRKHSRQVKSVAVAVSKAESLSGSFAMVKTQFCNRRRRAGIIMFCRFCSLLIVHAGSSIAHSEYDLLQTAKKSTTHHV